MDYIFDTILGLILGVIATYWVYSFFKKKKSKEVTLHLSKVFLEKIRRVSKLISVEGDFAEIYKYENTKERFLSLVSSKKKALIVINAKAQIGYDLNKVKISSDVDKKRITLTNFPQPEVLSIQPELEFYDIKNGMFNSFSPDDLTAVNNEAKNHILEKIPQSGLMESARKEALQAVLLIESIVATIGWELDYSSLEIEEIEKNNILEE